MCPLTVRGEPTSLFAICRLLIPSGIKSVISVSLVSWLSSVRFTISLVFRDDVNMSLGKNRWVLASRQHLFPLVDAAPNAPGAWAWRWQSPW